MSVINFLSLDLLEAIKTKEATLGVTHGKLSKPINGTGSQDNCDAQYSEISSKCSIVSRDRYQDPTMPQFRPNSLSGLETKKPVVASTLRSQPLQKLRRSTSLPNLTKASSLVDDEDGGCPYRDGNILHLQIPDTAPEHCQRRTIKAEIVKLFTPFTMAPVMVVSIFEPAFDLRGTFVLKVYDHRFSSCRKAPYTDEWTHWTASRDLTFHEQRWSEGMKGYYNKLLANDDLYYDPDDDENSEEDIDDEEEAGDEEVEIAH